MSARLLSTASEEVELVMMEEVGTTNQRPEYAKKVRIYHQMKALVSLLTLPRLLYHSLAIDNIL